MQIQLIGLPASGKSTLAAGLVKAYPNLYILGEKRYTSFKTMLAREPLRVLQILWMCLPVLPLCIFGVKKSEVSVAEKVSAIVGLILNLANYVYTDKTMDNRGKIVIWDELVLQRTLSIFAYSGTRPRNKTIYRFVKWTKRVCSCTAVFVTCESLHKERLLTRGVPIRMNNLSTESLQDVMATQRFVFSTVIGCLPKAMIVNTDHEIDGCLVDLHDYISCQS